MEFPPTILRYLNHCSCLLRAKFINIKSDLLWWWRDATAWTGDWAVRDGQRHTASHPELHTNTGSSWWVESAALCRQAGLTAWNQQVHFSAAKHSQSAEKCNAALSSLLQWTSFINISWPQLTSWRPYPGSQVSSCLDLQIYTNGKLKWCAV